MAIIISGGAIAIIVVMVSNSPELFLYIQGTNACSYARSFGLNAITLYVGAAAVIGMQGKIYKWVQKTKLTGHMVER